MEQQLRPGKLGLYAGNGSLRVRPQSWSRRGDHAPRGWSFSMTRGNSSAFAGCSTSCAALWGAVVELIPHTRSLERETGRTDPAYGKGEPPRWWLLTTV